MNEATHFICTYPSIVTARHTFQRLKPIIEKIFEYKEKGESFTASMIGEAIMGAKYHESHLVANYGHYKAYSRSSESLSLSSTLGYALYKMVKEGLVTVEVKKDFDHPHKYMDTRVCYTLNGKVLPEYITAETSVGPVEIDTSNIKGVKREWREMEVTGYPSIKWYTFKA